MNYDILILTGLYNNTKLGFRLKETKFITRNKLRFIVVLLCGRYGQLASVSGGDFECQEHYKISDRQYGEDSLRN
jgi:hypothetical protein